jgi:hypothetical protein
VSEYWIGLVCTPVEEPLRSHLKLPEGKGLVVVQVVEESPAASAGLQVHDVLISAGDALLATGEDLIAAVDRTKESELTLRIVRAGDEISIAVTPARRPADQAIAPEVQWLDVPGAEGPDGAVRRWIARVMPGATSRRIARFIGPGGVMPPGALLGAELPEGMSISIHKEGKEPAKITVQRGDESWEVTEENLDTLPDDVREHVERLLGGMPDFMVVPGVGERIEAEIVAEPPLPEDVERAVPQEMRRRYWARVPESDPEVHERLNRQLQELSEQIEALRDAIEELKDE